jgi:hypothetical protein
MKPLVPRTALKDREQLLLLLISTIDLGTWRMRVFLLPRQNTQIQRTCRLEPLPDMSLGKRGYSLINVLRYD